MVRGLVVDDSSVAMLESSDWIVSQFTVGGGAMVMEGDVLGR